MGSRSKMIKLVVCSLVLLILIKSSHQDPEDEEIEKRFNNAHLLRGRRSLYEDQEQELEKRFTGMNNGHLLRGGRALTANHFLRGKKSSANHFLRGRKSSANHFLRGRKFDRYARAAVVNHLFRGKKHDGDLRFLDELLQDERTSSYFKDLLSGFTEEDPEN